MGKNLYIKCWHLTFEKFVLEISFLKKIFLVQDPNSFMNHPQGMDERGKVASQTTQNMDVVFTNFVDWYHK